MPPFYPFTTVDDETLSLFIALGTTVIIPKCCRMASPCAPEYSLLFIQN